MTICPVGMRKYEAMHLLYDIAIDNLSKFEKEGKDMNKNIKAWARCAGVRAVRTIAQTAVAMLPVATTVTDVDWKCVIGTAALAGIASILTSIAGLPEAEKICK